MDQVRSPAFSRCGCVSCSGWPNWSSRAEMRVRRADGLPRSNHEDGCRHAALAGEARRSTRVGHIMMAYRHAGEWRRAHDLTAVAVDAFFFSAGPLALRIKVIDNGRFAAALASAATAGAVWCKQQMIL